MEIDSELTVEIPSEEAYGDRREDLVVEFDRSNIPETLDPQIGQQLELKQPDGNSLIMTVLDLKEDTITLDGNHPLAGHKLFFDLRLVEIA